MMIYIASRFGNQDRVKAFMTKVLTMTPRMGRITYTNTWQLERLEDVPDATKFPKVNYDYNQMLAARDIMQIQAADTLLALTEDCEAVTGAGAHFEAGYAYATGMRIIVVGPRLHVFHYLPEIEWYPSASAFLAKFYLSTEEVHA